MKKIGITGSIGSGKSAVGKLLKAHGFFVLDCDAKIHDLYAKSNALRSTLKESFGKEIVTPNGVSKEILANVVFKDVNKRELLESIVYPYLEKEIERFFKDSFALNASFSFVEAALFFKIPKTLSLLDEVWDVFAKENTRLTRLVARGLSKEDAMRRIEIQRFNPPLTHKHVLKIKNDGKIEDLERQILALLMP